MMVYKTVLGFPSTSSGGESCPVCDDVSILLIELLLPVIGLDVHISTNSLLLLMKDGSVKRLVPSFAFALVTKPEG